MQSSWYGVPSVPVSKLLIGLTTERPQWSISSSLKELPPVLTIPSPPNDQGSRMLVNVDWPVPPAKLLREVSIIAIVFDRPSATSVVSIPDFVLPLMFPFTISGENIPERPITPCWGIACWANLIGSSGSAGPAQPV